MDEAGSTTDGGGHRSGSMPSQEFRSLVMRTGGREHLNVVVEGCCHGELDSVYASIAAVEQHEGIKVDLLICCGDFQAIRSPQDLTSMSVPAKYRAMGDFHKYYSGEALAPVMTIFIGGNHEASNYLQELYYGGWVAPNIYFMGFSGCVLYGGIRICGLSGIYKDADYHRGRYEAPPYDNASCRSVYHVREVDCFKLAQLTGRVDIALSHDWPANIARHGDTEALLRKKPFFRQEIYDGTLGSPPAETLLRLIKPSYWFSAHLHVKFAAVMRHDGKEGVTRFLALDKCLPRRNFLQLVSVKRPAGEREEIPTLCYDPEWLAIVKNTHNLIRACRDRVTVPRESQRPSQQDIEWVARRLPRGHAIPFAPSFFPAVSPHTATFRQGNIQTDAFLSLLELSHVVTIPAVPGGFPPHDTDPNEITLPDDGGQ